MNHEDGDPRNDPADTVPGEWPASVWVGYDSDEHYPFYVATHHKKLTHRDEIEYIRADLALRGDTARELERLRAFRSAVIGWRENDWPEHFNRHTAELIAQLGEEAYLRDTSTGD